jgi:hypothetical protein
MEMHINYNNYIPLYMRALVLVALLAAIVLAADKNDWV